MSELDEIGFEFIEIAKLPYYWRLKIKGFQRRGPRCPWDGGSLAKRADPVDHLNCIKCGRNYV